MSAPDLSGATWRKSVRSGGNNNNCVEIGFSAHARGIRDTKEAGLVNRSTLAIDNTTFASFLDVVKSGRLDL